MEIGGHVASEVREPDPKDPGRPKDAATLLQQADALVETQVLEEMLGAGADRVFAVIERFENALPRDRGPFHYLSLLGADPEHAGQGYGMGLLAARLAEIARDGGGASLGPHNPG